MGGCHFAMAKRGWSKEVTGICQGFKQAIACLWTSISCLTIDGVAAFS